MNVDENTYIKELETRSKELDALTPKREQA